MKYVAWAGPKLIWHVPTIQQLHTIPSLHCFAAGIIISIWVRRGSMVSARRSNPRSRLWSWLQSGRWKEVRGNNLSTLRHFVWLTWLKKTECGEQHNDDWDEARHLAMVKSGLPISTINWYLSTNRRTTYQTDQDGSNHVVVVVKTKQGGDRYRSTPSPIVKFDLFCRFASPASAEIQYISNVAFYSKSFGVTLHLSTLFAYNPTQIFGQKLHNISWRFFVTMFPVYLANNF